MGLFNRPARDANCHKSEPNVKNLDAKDEEKYYEALKLTQDAFNALKEEKPQVGAGAAKGKLPGCPPQATGLNCASNLAKISQELNKKYKKALDDWCDEYIDGADIIVGQGG